MEEEPWTGVRSVFSHPEQCIQMPFLRHLLGDISEEHVLGSEDCLYLNVFTPKVQYVRVVLRSDNRSRFSKNIMT